MNSDIHMQGWISVPIAAQFEDRARNMRDDRDRCYGNLYPECKTDERWVGDLGEIVFNSWLKHQGVEEFRWVLDDTAGRPDFITSGSARIGVKTVKRKGPPRWNYTAQITARHVDEPVDQFFFLTYDMPERRMWLLGGIDRDSFIGEARHYAAGEQVHEYYTVRPGHEIYNLGLDRLIKPRTWLAFLRATEWCV